MAKAAIISLLKVCASSMAEIAFLSILEVV